MKYEKEMYIESGIYGDDEEIRNKKEKVVKCRKEHRCATCAKMIKLGDEALYEHGFLEGKPVSCYTCLPCIEKWLEESGQID